MQFIATVLVLLATFATVGAAEPAPLFLHCPTNAGWVTIWDSEWTQPANDAGQRVDNGSQLILAQSASKGNYFFTLLEQTPWGSQKYSHTLRLPAGMKGGYTDQVVWPMVEGKDRSPLSWDRALAPKGDLYLGFYVRFRGSAGRPYRLENLGGQKLLYARPAPATGTGSFAHIFIRKGGTPTGGGWAGFEPQPMHTVCESAAYFTEPSAPIGIDDRWNQIEFRIIANTRSKTNHLADGRVEIYVDGTLQHRQTNATIYCTGQESATMNSLSLNPIYGGGRNPVPYDLYVDYGRMRVMAR